MATNLLPRVGPKLGRKQIFLPNIPITFLNTPKHAPTFASFIVPLNLNKLDMRDLLWNMYGLNALSVRSYIQLQKMERGNKRSIKQNESGSFRPRSKKRMMVEMERPFVWPEIKNFNEWDKESFKKMNKEQEQTSKAQQPTARRKPTTERKSFKQQARQILAGEEPWKPTPRSNEWEEGGEEVEVEQDVQLPRSER